MSDATPDTLTQPKPSLFMAILPIALTLGL